MQKSYIIQHDISDNNTMTKLLKAKSITLKLFFYLFLKNL